MFLVIVKYPSLRSLPRFLRLGPLAKRGELIITAAYRSVCRDQSREAEGVEGEGMAAADTVVHLDMVDMLLLNLQQRRL